MMLKIIFYFFYHYLTCIYKQTLFVRRKTYRDISCIYNIQDIKIYKYIYLYMKIFLLDSIFAFTKFVTLNLLVL